MLFFAIYHLLLAEPSSCPPPTHLVPLQVGPDFITYEVNVTTTCGGIILLTGMVPPAQQTLVPGLQQVTFAGLSPGIPYSACFKLYCEMPCSPGNESTPLCHSFTLNACSAPPPPVVVNRTATSLTLGGNYMDCGGVMSLHATASLPPMFQVEVPSGSQQTTFSGLVPDTEYFFCHRNRCLKAGFITCVAWDESPAECLSIKTEVLTTCAGPTQYQLQNLAARSLQVQSHFESFGGRVEARLAGNVVAQSTVSAGSQVITLGGLQPSTTYNVCFYNYCDMNHTILSTSLCANITTKNECLEIDELELLALTPFSYEVRVTFGEFGGSAKLYTLDGQFTETLYPKGVQTLVNPYPLSPATFYTICARNACNAAQSQFTAENCLPIQTAPEQCVPPPLLNLTAITSNSMVLNAQAGPFGAQVEISAENQTQIREMNAGATQKLLDLLADATTYQISVRNHCYTGTLSDAITTSASTASAAQANGLLTPPSFIDESWLWAEKGRARLVLPDPNSDGWDRFGSAQLAYFIRMLEPGCPDQPLFETEYSSPTWPIQFAIPVPIPATPYEVEISRVLKNSKGGSRSSGTVLVGPPNNNVTQISTQALEIKRWILHVPRKSGGFSGTLVMQNRFPDLPARLWVAGFDQAGQFVAGSAKALTVIGRRAEIAIYPEAGTSLFPEEMTDAVSHLGLFEEYDRTNLGVAITYSRAGDPRGLTATVPEADLRKGQANGTVFSLESRTSPLFWDGAALLNLTQSSPTEIVAHQRNLADDAIQASISLGAIEPGAKKLVVLSDLFPFCADCYYSLETTQNKRSLQLLGLRGTLGTANTVLVESVSQKKN